MNVLVESVPGMQPAPWSAVVAVIVFIIAVGPLLLLAITLLDRRARR